jgi:hypothetical protein
MTMSRRVTSIALAACVVAAGVGYASVASARRSGGTVRFKAADLKVETNATDGDAGLQIFLDHEPWRSIAIAKPDGTRIVDLQTQGVLRNYGLTELFSESSEPPFTEFPLEEFKKLFPEGDYAFTGETIDGVRMRSSVALTHDLPAGPEITAPADGDTVPHGDVVLRWTPGNQPTGVELVGFQVVVSHEAKPVRVLEADVDDSLMSFTIPSEFLEPGAEYKAEVLAIEKSGNQTLTEITFSIA